MQTEHLIIPDPYDLADMYPPTSDTEFSPIRKLALAVLRHAIYQAAHPRVSQWNRTDARINGVAGKPVEWLSRWDLVEPWCLAAEIPVGRMKRRIEEVVGERAVTRLAA